MSWPSDADGDVFRRLQAHGLDFAREHEIEFNVDFDSWPVPTEALQLLRAIHPELSLIEPGATHPGYLQFQLRARLTYTLVTETQSRTSSLVARYGGVCESWGVMQA